MRTAIAFGLTLLFVTSFLFSATPGELASKPVESGLLRSASPGNATRHITTLPYTQDFEGAVFPPEDWTRYNRDTQGTEWELTTVNNHTMGGSQSACHLHHNSSIDEDGWLVTPLVDVPQGQGVTLSFWSFNVNPQDYGTSTVLVSTTSPNPDIGNYVGIWSPITVSDRWVFNMVDLSPWAGQSVYIAFWYRGFPTYEWILDDVTIELHSGVHSIPWEESFESGIFPPYYWWQFDVDGSGTSWSWNQTMNHSEDGICSAMHLADDSDPEEDGWLILPQIHVPTGSAYSLSFWSYCENPGLYVNGSNSVMVSTGSPYPQDGDYMSIWSPIRVNDEWTYNLTDLTPWSGQAVWIAFRYQGQGAHDWYLDDVRIEEYIGIQTFPWGENFESGVFAPYYWTSFDQDGGGTYWSWNEIFNHSDDGNCSAMHIWDNVDPVEDGWLVTPLLRLPYGEDWALSFWSKNINPAWYGSNSVWLSTGSLDPNDGNYVQIWHPTSVVEDWTLDTVDLSNWAGQNVFLAFRYQGHDAHDWYLDDVCVEVLTGDFTGPEISHLPLLNTLRDDIPYPVYAEAVDPSGVAYVGIYYQINGGDWIWEPMTLLIDGWYGEIPAQPHGTQINYVLVAADNNDNLTYTSGFGFSCDEPVWLYYDSQSHNTWAGWNFGEWELAVLYANPLYGTGEPLKINRVSAAFMLSDTVHLKIYAASDASVNNLTPLIDPVEVTCPADAWIEIPVNDLNIDSPYFYVVYAHIDANNGFAADNQRYYPGRCYMILDSVPQDLGNLGFNGVWMLRVNVQSAGLLEAPVLSIIEGNDGPELHWTEVAGADLYKVYASDDPYLDLPWSLFDSTAGLALGALGDAPYKFFKVTAESSRTADIEIGADPVTVPVNATRKPRYRILPKN